MMKAKTSVAVNVNIYIYNSLLNSCFVRSFLDVDAQVISDSNLPRMNMMNNKKCSYPYLLNPVISTFLYFTSFPLGSGCNAFTQLIRLSYHTLSSLSHYDQSKSNPGNLFADLNLLSIHSDILLNFVVFTGFHRNLSLMVLDSN